MNAAKRKRKEGLGPEAAVSCQLAMLHSGLPRYTAGSDVTPLFANPAQGGYNK